MATIEESVKTLNNTASVEEHSNGDWTPFHLTVIACSAFIGLLILLNILFCCLTRYKGYWRNRNTGKPFVEFKTILFKINF